MPGIYYVLVARRVESWDIGFPVSNLAAIEILAPESKSSDSAPSVKVMGQKL